MPERAYLSIGEVLALLKDEFSDITISKIRFLESQGLIDPERTPSGYRKFYDPDVERLRWILRQQKEHYLPLRVIKGKLSEAPSADDDGSPRPRGIDGYDGEDDDEDEGAGNGVVAAGGAPTAKPPALAAVPDPPDDDGSDAGGAEAVRQEPAPGATSRRETGRASADGGSAAQPAPPEPEAGPQPARRGRRAAPPFPESLRRSTRSSPASFLTAPAPATEPPPPPPPPAPAPAPAAGRVEDPDMWDEEVELTADELAAASGLSVGAVAELERYGLVKGQRGPGGRYYDEAALDVARLAAEFARFGVEARHLRMWRTAADREADFYEQVVTPLRSQRSAKARRQAGDTVSELAQLGARLHAALVAGAMKRLT